MKICYDFFSGTGSATKAFEEHPDWKVIRVEKNLDIVERFGAEIQADILDLQPSDFKHEPDFIWASPPCTKFSIAAISNHWNKVGTNYYPKQKDSVEAIRLVYHTMYLIESLNPEYWVIENPRSVLRKIIGLPLGTVSYCQYGDSRMKPTDLYGFLPDSFEFKLCSNGDSCHESAPRGSSTGTQGLSGNTERSRVPYGLSKAVLDAVENPKGEKQGSLRELL